MGREGGVGLGGKRYGLVVQPNLETIEIGYKLQAGSDLSLKIFNHIVSFFR